MTTSRISIIDTDSYGPPSSTPFVMFPPALAACQAQLERTEALYRLALEKALEINRPSRWAPLYRVSMN